MSKDIIYREDAINSIYKLKETVIKHNVLNYRDGLFDALENIQDLPSADRPSGEDCEFCRCHEKDDVLYELLGWDRGFGFDEIRNIKYCPLCGAILKGADDE